MCFRIRLVVGSYILSIIICCFNFLGFNGFVVFVILGDFFEFFKLVYFVLMFKNLIFEFFKVIFGVLVKILGRFFSKVMVFCL